MEAEVLFSRTDFETGFTFFIFKNDRVLHCLRSPYLPPGVIVNYDDSVKILTPCDKTPDDIKQRLGFFNAVSSFMSMLIFEKVCRQSKTPLDDFLTHPFTLMYATDPDTEEEYSAASAFDISGALVPPLSGSILIEEAVALVDAFIKEDEAHGDTYTTRASIINRFSKFMAYHKRDTTSVSQRVNDVLDNEPEYFRCTGDLVSRTETYMFEQSVASVVVLAEKTTSQLAFKVNEPIEGTSIEQGQAISSMLSSTCPLQILTGGPGTGKTTTVKAFVATILSHDSYAVIKAAAYSNKAAKRLAKEMVPFGIEATTVHTMLGYGKRNRSAFIEEVRYADYIIIDEASMLTMELFEELSTLVDLTRTKLILVGDVNQLPSIDAGAILSDLIKEGVPVHRLTENFRSGDVIVENASKILTGNADLSYSDLFEIEPLEEDIDNGVLAKLMRKHGVSIEKDSDIVITPFASPQIKGSTFFANAFVTARERARHASPFFIGARVIFIENNKHAGYTNGDTGIIEALNSVADTYVVRKDNAVVEIPRYKAKEAMALGYAITVHKSQGSEYDNVHILLPFFSPFITRRMLYTAITRAKRSVVLYTNPSIVERIIANDADSYRKTLIPLFIEERRAS